MNQHNYSEYKQTSVKVHQPPGGGSQFSIGWSGEEQAQPSRVKARGYQNQQQQSSWGQAQPRRGGYEQEDTCDRGYGGNQMAQKRQSRQMGGGGYGGYGEREDAFGYQGAQSYGQQQRSYGNDAGFSHGQRQPAMRTENNLGDDGRTSVKVHNPPGGRSSINVFGGGDEQVIAPQNNRGQPVRNSRQNEYARDQGRRDIYAEHDFAAAFGGQNMRQQFLQQQQRAQQNRHSDAGNFHARYADEFEAGVVQPQVQFPSQMNKPREAARQSRGWDGSSGGGRQQQRPSQAQNSLQEPSYGNEMRYGHGQRQPVMRTENNLGDDGRTSVKVHNPPGGRSNFSLF